MAKYCNVCNQSYGDDEPFCPRCNPLIDLTEEETPPPSAQDEEPVEVEALEEIDEETNAINLEGRPQATEAYPSDLRLVKDALVEDETAQVDLSMLTEEPEQTEDQAKSADSDSSEVDLEGSAPAPTSDAAGVNLGRLAEESETEADEAEEVVLEPGSETKVVPEHGLEPPEPMEPEEEAPVEEEETVKPKKPTPPPQRQASPHYGKRWLGGGVLGAVVGAAACIALWVFGFELPSGWRLGGGPSDASVKVPPQPAPPRRPSQEIAAENLKVGEFSLAVAELDNVPEPSSEILTQRGLARWLSYLQQQKEKNAPLNSNDEPVKQAREELNKAGGVNNPEALFYLAQIEEWTGKRETAVKAYADGLNKYKEDRVWQARFQAALDRLAAQGVGLSGTPLGWRPEADPTAAAQALIVLLTSLQVGPPAGPPSPVVPPAEADAVEAGFGFWKAVKLAQGGQYKEALETLKEARKLHDTKRFSRLRKAQNPRSDPTEDIFLQCCDQLVTYWQLHGQLRGEAKLDLQGDAPIKALAALIQNKDLKIDNALKELKTVKEDLQQTKEKADLAQKKAEDTEKSLKNELMLAKKEYETLQTKLATQTNLLKASEDRLKGVQDRLAAAGFKNADAAQGVDQLAGARNEAEKLLDGATTKLQEARYISPGTGKAGLLKAVAQVVDVAQTKDPGARIAANEKEIKNLQDLLARRPTQEEPLDIWLPLLASRGPFFNLTQPVADAERVLREKAASPVARAKAQAVLGMCQRNQGNWDSARTTLNQALAATTDKGNWKLWANTALMEITDPAVYYLPRVQFLLDSRGYEKALPVLDQALAVFPKDKGTFLALRSKVRLDLAREKREGGPLEASNPELNQARQDAEAAAAAGSAEGYYLLGLISEETGDLAQAGHNYRLALNAHPQRDEAGNKYRIGVARVQIKMLRQKPALKQTSTANPGPENLRLGALRDLPPFSLVLLLQVPAVKAPNPTQEEATQLADEVLASKTSNFMDRAQALAIKGLWTKALQTYVEGLRRHLRRDYAEGLLNLVQNHPALKRPDSLAIPDPLLAEVHYATGLRNFWSGRYADAERDFLESVTAFNQDARYFFYLGLTRLALNKPGDAEADFEQGGRLEAQGQPGRSAVSAALERIQGSPRKTLNRFRP